MAISCAAQRFTDAREPFFCFADELIGAGAHFLAFPDQIIQTIAGAAPKLFPALRPGTRGEQNSGHQPQANTDYQIRNIDSWIGGILAYLINFLDLQIVLHSRHTTDLESQFRFY